MGSVFGLISWGNSAQGRWSLIWRYVMQTVREFNHKRFGHLGKVVLESNVTTIKLNGKPVAESSIEYLLNFALQSLQDAYAGAENAEQAQGLWDKKLDAILNGTLGARSGGAGVDEFTKTARSILKGKLKTQLGKDSAEWKEFDESDADVQNARLDSLFTKNEAKLRPIVEERLEELKRERARKAKLASNGELEL